MRRWLAILAGFVALPIVVVAIVVGGVLLLAIPCVLIAKLFGMSPTDTVLPIAFFLIVGTFGALLARDEYDKGHPRGER